ncbi:MAG: PD40 domain-containing protein [Cyclobacteriaceae bacterium]|nr:PD40 domain-containing protein [Cyclobacteriaceae bacterium]
MRYIPLLFVVSIVILSCRGSKSTETFQLKIVYNYLHDTLGGEYEIYTMNMDGSEQKNISNSLYSNDWVYHTYKDRIFFISDRDTTKKTYFVYEMNSQGQNVRKVSDLRVHNAWMSSRNNGRELVVSGRIDGAAYMQLFLINTETGAYTQLTHDTSAMYSDPLFSPDGQQLFFRYRAHKRNATTEKAEIWKLDLRDSTMEQLTHFPESDTNHVWYSYHAGPPKWHGGELGTFISYQSIRDKHYSLFRISPEGGKSVKIFEDQKLFTGWHDWSPDGKWLVLDMYDNLQTEFDIYLVNWQTSEVKRLTYNLDLEQAPCFVQEKN